MAGTIESTGGGVDRTVSVSGELAKPGSASEGKCADPPAKWRVLGKVLLGFVIAVAGSFTGDCIAAGCAVVAASAGNVPANVFESPGLLPGYVTGSSLVLIALGLAMGRGPGATPEEQVGLVPSRLSVIRLVVAVTGVITLGWTTMLALRLLAGGEGRSLTALTEATRQATLPWFVVQLIVLAGLGPVAEEVFFRGFIQRDLRRAFGPLPSILVASGMFAVVHLDMVQSTVAFVVGVYLGWLAERARSIRPAILAHVCNNLLVFVMIRALNDTTPQQPVLDVQYAAVFVAGTVVTAALVWYQHRRFERGG